MVAAYNYLKTIQVSFGGKLFTVFTQGILNLIKSCLWKTSQKLLKIKQKKINHREKTYNCHLLYVLNIAVNQPINFLLFKANEES